MQIELFGNKNLVCNVNVAIVGPCIEVFLNCSERWPVAQRLGASHFYLAEHANSFNTHDCIAVSADTAGHSPEDECHVVLIPEK